ncbi:hypothetical protein FACS1894206_09670 [Deltaproteobacteria bacterium]|nr:hypothetical protein FACS1894206_09670 [Deltaproteobacteria bacterium]
MNHDHTQLRQRRQDRPKQLRETGAIYAMRVADFMAARNRFCGPVKPVELALPPLEIDHPEDLLLAEAFIAAQSTGKQSRPPPEIKALVMDFDGVHTDDCVYVSQRGEEMVKCSRSDGLGVALLRKAGFTMLILSTEENPVVAARAKKLGVPVIQGCAEKKNALEQWIAEQGLLPKEVAYVGNDVNDLECMNLVGWSCCPADAGEAVKAAADYVTERMGGNGAVREIIGGLI